MASYSSYKKITSENVDGRIIGESQLKAGAGMPRGVLWVYPERGMRCHACANNGSCVCQACGRCCQWTVPNSVTNVTFEIWSGGGGGPGITCCDCYQKAIGGAGGNYAIKHIETSPGSNYTVCAGGSWRCSKAYTSQAEMGCKSFVTGSGLDNFCTVGGCGGCSCNEGQSFDPRTMETCANCGVCGIYGADFGMMGSTGYKSGEGRVGNSACACIGRDAGSGVAPLIGRTVWNHASRDGAQCACGCYVNFPAGGGMAGISTLCGQDSGICCSGGSGQGGAGIVKITFS